MSVCGKRPAELSSMFTPSTLGHDRSFLSYVAYVKKMDVKAYPDDQFVHANVPPLVVSQLLNLTVAKSIAASHGIVTSSRCTVAQLRSFVEQHECVNCPSYLTVFSVESDPATKHAIRNRNYRKNLKAHEQLTQKTEPQAQATEFPPSA